LSTAASAKKTAQTVTLKGSGLMVATAAPASVSYGSQRTGSRSAARVIKITSNLNGPVSLTDTATTGDFAIKTNSCGSLLKARGSCLIQVSFTPSAPGPRKGSLIIGDSASPLPITVPLSGNGN
jgi:hypothetical protein